MKKFILFVLSCSLLWMPLIARGTSETFNDYTVYYQAVNSTFLDADIAQQYDIVRSKRHAFLNISVMKKDADGKMSAVPARVSGSKRNLLQQVSNIEFREIREANAIYYIGEFDFSNAEIIRFRLSIEPEAAGESFEINWETRMYEN